MRTRAIIAIALFISAIAFMKQGYCAEQNWQQPATDIHMCYTDIAPLYSLRHLDKKAWPYSEGDKSLEYPVITGVVTYLLALPTNTANSFYFLNAFFLVALFLAIAYLINKFKPEFSYLYPLAPAGVLAFFINWDFWGIISMVGAIIWFDRKRYELSAIALALSISTKFMPVFLAIPVALLLWRAKKLTELLRYALVAIGTFLAINLPVFLTTPKAWLHFYLFNINRKADWGSIWYALRVFKVRFADLNVVMTIFLLLAVLIASLVIIGARAPIGLADVSFIVMALVFTASKVYSPQYVLWLIPLAVLALKDKRDLHAFWIWQGGEVLYYVAIWQHLALLEHAKFGLALEPYALAIFIRVIATIYLVERLIARLRVKIHKTTADFLFEGASSYP